MKKSIRVLQVIPSLARGAGVASFVYNMERYHDESRVHYDFLHHSVHNGKHIYEKNYEEELKASGCAVYAVNNAAGDLVKFIREVHKFFDNSGSKYDIVHCHMPNAAFCILREAERVGIKHRIIHSHLNNSSDKVMHQIRNAPLNMIGKMYATDFLACSKDAGLFLFKKHDFKVINNGIPLDLFAYNISMRQSLRKNLGIAMNDPVIGCVGRFVKQKNFTFVLDIFKCVVHEVPNAKLIILGDGDLRSEIEQKIAEERMDGSVLLLGIREDVNIFYSVFDVFLMPSLYEGLPVSALEAQASGLHCIYSKNVPCETDVTNTGIFLSLDDNVCVWADKLIETFSESRLTLNPEIMGEYGYSSRSSADALMCYYEQLMGVE